MIQVILSSIYPIKNYLLEKAWFKRKNPYLLSALLICFANKQGFFSPLSVTQFQTEAYPNPQENQKSKKRNLLRLNRVVAVFTYALIYTAKFFVIRHNIT